jgi:Holliday junction resolvase RusA-like endonuclease
MAGRKAMKAATIGRSSPWEKTIYGEAASKANSRKLVHIGGKPVIIKSDKARGYLADFLKQCPVLEPMFMGDVYMELTMYYASRRPDLDESIVMDALQGRVYENDRQVKRKHVVWGLDPDNPRVELRISLLKPEA